MSKYVCMTSNQFAEATAVKPPFRKSNTVHFMLKGQLLVIARETTPLPHKSTDIPDRPTKLKIRGKISIIMHNLHFVAAICPGRRRCCSSHGAPLRHGAAAPLRHGAAAPQGLAAYSCSMPPSDPPSDRDLKSALMAARESAVLDSG